jgi:hypothetical protein
MYDNENPYSEEIGADEYVEEIKVGGKRGEIIDARRVDDEEMDIEPVIGGQS